MRRVEQRGVLGRRRLDQLTRCFGPTQLQRYRDDLETVTMEFIA
jgi:hypothetical protein